jgi:hypothetical protein
MTDTYSELEFALNEMEQEEGYDEILTAIWDIMFTINEEFFLQAEFLSEVSTRIKARWNAKFPGSYLPVCICFLAVENTGFCVCDLFVDKIEEDF